MRIHRLSHTNAMSRIAWLLDNNIDYTIVERMPDPRTFEMVPSKICFENEQDELMFVLRFS